MKQLPLTHDFFDFAESLPRSGHWRKLALAFPKEMHDDNLDFFVTAAKNRGVNINLFSSMEKAIDWITNNDG